MVSFIFPVFIFYSQANSITPKNYLTSLRKNTELCFKCDLMCVLCTEHVLKTITVKLLLCCSDTFDIKSQPSATLYHFLSAALFPQGSP